MSHDPEKFTASSVGATPEIAGQAGALALAAGSAYRTPDGMLICCLCQCEMEWEDCSACGGDGFFDGYEEDPNWYQPGECVDCSQCGGEGGAHVCPTRDCKTFTCLRVLPSPNAVVSHTGALPDAKISNQVPRPGVGL